MTNIQIVLEAAKGLAPGDGKVELVNLVATYATAAPELAMSLVDLALVQGAIKLVDDGRVQVQSN